MTVMCLLHEIHMCLACAVTLPPSLSLPLYYRIYKVLSEYQVLSAAASTHTHTHSQYHDNGNLETIIL